MFRKLVSVGFVVTGLMLCTNLGVQGRAKKSRGIIDVSGKVIDLDGNAIANAKVYACLHLYKTAEDKVLQHTISAEDGSFNFRGLVSPDTKNEYLYFIATAPAFAIGWTRLTEEMDLGDIEILLETPPVSISGRVVDKELQPIEGALVKAHVRSCPWVFLPDWLKLACGVTDKDGKFTIANLPEFATVSLTILHEDYAIKSQGDVSTPRPDLVFVLHPGATIEGRVIFKKTGKPAEGVSVFCLPSPAVAGIGRWKAKTDSEGRYILSSLPPRTYNIDIRRPVKEGKWTAPLQRNIEISEGSSVKNVNFYLVKTGFVTGKVTNAETGEPVPGARVSAPDYGIVTTGEDGRYRFPLPRGQIKLLCEKSDEYLSSEEGWVTIEAERTIQGVDFKLKPGITVAGKVILREGNPVPGAWVILRLTIKMTRREIKQLTDSQGRFCFRGIPPDVIIKLHARFGDFQKSERKEVCLGKESVKDIVLELK